jgi:hypothetical protein
MVDVTPVEATIAAAVAALVPNVYVGPVVSSQYVPVPTLALMYNALLAVLYHISPTAGDTGRDALVVIVKVPALPV